MTLAEKYGIQSNTKVEEINLNQNPYKFEGTFKEFYGLVASGKVKALTQYGITCGISVGGYETIEQDNLAGKAFAEAYSPSKALRYLNLATQLVEANLIPNIISEDPLRVTILNGLVTLDENGEEVNDVDATDGCEYTGPSFSIDGIVYIIKENPETGRPMIARLDGEKIKSRKEVAIEYLVTHAAYPHWQLVNKKTSWLEKKVAERLEN